MSQFGPDKSVKRRSLDAQTVAEAGRSDGHDIAVALDLSMTLSKRRLGIAQAVPLRWDHVPAATYSTAEPAA